MKFYYKNIIIIFQKMYLQVDYFQKMCEKLISFKLLIVILIKYQLIVLNLWWEITCTTAVFGTEI